MNRSTDDLIQSLDRAFRRIRQQQNQNMEQPETLDLECDTGSECTDYEPPTSRRRGGRKSNKRTLVLLTSIEVSANKVPKGKQKESKKKIGMIIKEASFRKNNSSKQVIQTITESFEKALRNLKMKNLSIIKVLFFKSEQDPHQRKLVFRSVGENLTGEELLNTFKKSEKPVYIALKLAKADVGSSQNIAAIPTNAITPVVRSDLTSLPSSVATAAIASAPTIAATRVTPYATTDVTPAVTSYVTNAYSVTSRIVSSTPSADQEREQESNATDGHAATIRRRQALLSTWSSTAIDLTSPPSPAPEDGYSSPPSPALSHIGGMLSVRYPEIVVVCPSLMSTTNVQAIERLAGSSALSRNLDVVIKSCGISCISCKSQQATRIHQASELQDCTQRSNIDKDQSLIKEQETALQETEKQKAAERPKETEEQKEAEERKGTEEQNGSEEPKETKEQTGIEYHKAAEEQQETEQQKENAEQNTTDDSDDSFIKNFIRNRKKMEKERLERKAMRQEQNRQNAEIGCREYAQNHSINQIEMRTGEKESEKKEKKKKRKMNENNGIMTRSKQKKLHK